MLPALIAAFLLQASPGESTDFESRDRLLGDPAGVRADLDAHGLSWTLAYTGEVISNASGGVQRDVAVDHLLDWVIDADFGKMLGWTGGSARLNPMLLAGDGLVGDTGDLTRVSNINGRGGVRIFEFWLQQGAFDGALSLRAGVLAADQEFAITSAGQLYYNSVFGGPVFMTANFAWPIYPVGAPGLRLRVDPAAGFYVQAAVYDGDPGSERFNRSGLRVRWNHSEGVFSIVEGGWTSGGERPGSLKAGAFYHTADFPRYDTGGTGSGLAGGYALAEQCLAKGIDAFLRVGVSQEDRSVVALGADGGFNFTGLLPGRARDVLGLGLIYARLGKGFVAARPDPGPWGYESVFEATYKVVVTPAWSLQPDLQYVMHPGGSGQIHNALVLGLRVDLTF